MRPCVCGSLRWAICGSACVIGRPRTAAATTKAARGRGRSRAKPHLDLAAMAPLVLDQPLLLLAETLLARLQRFAPVPPGRAAGRAGRSVSAPEPARCEKARSSAPLGRLILRQPPRRLLALRLISASNGRLEQSRTRGALRRADSAGRGRVRQVLRCSSPVAVLDEMQPDAGCKSQSLLCTQGRTAGNNARKN